MNKKIVMLALALTLPLSVSAYASSGGKGGPEGHMGHKLERLVKKLGLNEDQKSKLEIIFKEQGKKFKALHEETRQRMNGVLTPEQITKLDEMKKRHMEKWKKRKEEMKMKKQEMETQTPGEMPKTTN